MKLSENRLRLTFGMAFWALVLMALFSPSASAADKGGFSEPRTITMQDYNYSYSGIYVGIGAGGAFGGNEVDVRSATDLPLFNADGLSSFGWRGDGRVGIDWQMKDSPFLIGLLGGWNIGESKFTSFKDGDPLVETSLTPTWYAGGRVGLVLPTNSKTPWLVYVGYRYVEADFDVTLTGKSLGVTCATSGITCSHTLNGHGFIGGLEVPFTKALTGALEYSYTDYDDVTVASGEAVRGKVVTSNNIEHTVMARLNLKIGPNLFSGDDQRR